MSGDDRAKNQGASFRKATDYPTYLLYDHNILDVISTTLYVEGKQRYRTRS